MLSFRPIELNDKEEIEKYTSKIKSYLCEHCFVDLFIWRYYYSTQICIKNGFLFIKMQTKHNNTTMYLAPIGKGDLKNAIEEIEKDAEERKVFFRMISITEDLKSEIENIMKDRFSFEEQRDNADYIYNAQDLITLKGKKYHSKRNFINRFKINFDGRWKYEDITAENAKDIFNYHIKWCEMNECTEKDSFMGETCVISQILRNFEVFNMKGGLIRLDGNIIAFTLGCQSREDMFIVQIEKADHTIQGAYQMINQQFAERNFNLITYVNREEDLGIEGLRKAKLSYYPVIMGTNYMATYKNLEERS